MKIYGIQYLRAMAALMVAYFHLVVQVPAYTATLYAPVLVQFSRGVDLFFVISGFVMVLTSSHLSPARFMSKRIGRVVPLYWLLTGLLVALALIAPHMFRSTQLSFAYLVKSLFFVPFANPGQHGNLEPLLVPGWTLNYEMFFYAVFAALLLTKHRLLYCGALFAALVAAGPLLPPDSVLRFYCQPVILEFVAGMAIAQYYRRLRLHWMVSAALVIGGFIALLQPSSTAIAALAAASVVLGTCTLEPRIPRIAPLLALGDASYSIYLTHLFVFGATRVLWKGGPVGFAIFSMVAVVVVSLASYRWVERPIMRMGRQRGRPGSFAFTEIQLRQSPSPQK